jgi:ketosteroid isomerase-like protein
MTKTRIRASLCLALALGALAAPTAWARTAAAAAGSAALASPEEILRIEKEIRGLEEKFNRVYEHNDMNAYWSFYSDDSTQLWDNGRVGLEQYKKDWTALLKAGGGVREIKMEDLQARVSPAGDAAVGSYRIFVRLRDAAGKESSDWYHESDVWFRRGGEWKIVYLHYSRAGPSPLPAEGEHSQASAASLPFRRQTIGFGPAATER